MSPSKVTRQTSRTFRPPLTGSEAPVREVQAVSFADLIRMLSQSIADAQMELDRASAELVAELASTKVNIVPRITETVDDDGSIHYSAPETQEVSLLDIGVTPTFYQFSEARVEVAIDIKVVENVTESSDGTVRYGLFADTASVRYDRKLNRDVAASSRVSAVLNPKPSPLRLEPVRTTEMT